MLSVMLACGIVSRLVFGWISDYIGGAATLLLSAGLQAVALALFLPNQSLDVLFGVSALFVGGVLALQGDVREHLAALRACGAEAVPVRRPAELDAVDAVVLPGGESTTMSRLLATFELRDPLFEHLGPLVRANLLFVAAAGDEPEESQPGEDAGR